MTDPPLSASDGHSQPPARPRKIVGPVETFTRVDPPVSEPRPTGVPAGPGEDPGRFDAGDAGDAGDAAPRGPDPEAARDVDADGAKGTRAEPLVSDEVREPPALLTVEEIDAARTPASPSPAPIGPVPGDMATGEGGDGPEGPGGSSAWWRYGFPAAMVVLVLAIPLLVYAGSRVLLDSDEGRVVSAETDPEAPGWEAVVDPTPVHTVAVADADGGLDHIVVQFLTGSNSGGVVVVPSETVFDSGRYGDIPLSQLFDNGGGSADGGAEAIRGALQSILGIGIDEIQVLDPDEWAPLVAPVAPLTINNPDDVIGTGAQGEALAFPKGSLQVAASEAWPYIEAEHAGEDPINRAYRIESFWRGWLSAVSAAGDAPGKVPGEIDTGLGYFVRSLATGTVEVTTLPVATVTGPEGELWFQPQEADVRALIAALDPYPSGPLGERVRIRVLDGTGELDHGLDAANLLAASGAQIDKVGNAFDFDHETTQFVFYDPALREKVQALRDALGVGELVQSEEQNVTEDVTVVLGQDHLAVVGPAGTSNGAGASELGGDS